MNDKFPFRTEEDREGWVSENLGARSTKFSSTRPRRVIGYASRVPEYRDSWSVRNENSVNYV